MKNNFSKNLKYLRESKGLSQQDIADKIGVNRSTIGYWETGKADPTLLNVCRLADFLNIDLITFVSNELYLNSNESSNITSNMIEIPVFGIMKVGLPIEAQDNIIDYIKIPKNWKNGNQNFFGLKINDDSMSPKYQTDDIVIFEQNNDIKSVDNKDCIITIDNKETVFKKVLITEKGVTLVPYNVEYEPLFFTHDEINDKPVKIIGIAREKRTKIN